MSLILRIDNTELRMLNLLHFYPYLRISISFFGIFFASNCIAQEKNSSTVSIAIIDSLQNALLNAKSDTSRAAIYVSLSEALYLSHVDTVLPLCFKAIGIADASIYKANSAEKNSLLTSKANALNNIGYVYKKQGNITKALEWYTKSLKIREETGNKHGIANSINNIGHIHNIQGDVRKATEYFNKSSHIFIQEFLRDF